ncbi:hypothetical protein HCN44_008952 [Aphidius gifuensis]|uniref:Uncharacterized protein n=1 Tax=Aphidius gifuensis TaxID=684658 RepID=A0A834XSV0_APHGI|nr:hypothetical protein HCN44_008952 [Aphidius gifuensis]
MEHRPTSSLRRPSVIAQHSTPAPIDDVVNNDEAERLRNRMLIADDSSECINVNSETYIIINNQFIPGMRKIVEHMVKKNYERLTPAPINDVDNDDETKRSRSGESLGLSAGGIAKRRKLNTQNEINIKNTTQLESSSLRSRSAIAQGSTPAPINNVVNDDEIKRLKSPTSLKVLKMTSPTETEQQITDYLAEMDESLERMKNQLL